MGNNISATEIAYFNMDSDEEFGENYIETLDNVTVFQDEIKKNLKCAGFLGDMNNTEEIVDFICVCCEKELLDDFDNPNDKSRSVKLNKKTLTRWFVNNNIPEINTVSREIMFKLCFALKMNEEATKSFLNKGCLERSFNFKNIKEAVYYFCLKNGINFETAKKIISKVEKSNMVQNPDADNETIAIAQQIKKIQNEKELIDYLICNKCGFINSNSTAYNLINNELLPECMSLATKELKFLNAQTSQQYKTEEIDNIDKLLSVIYGYDARATVDKEKVYKHSISDKTSSKFPKLIKENFPQREQFKNISKCQASDSVVKKALIMLSFYEFFTKAYLDNNESMNSDLCDEFIDEMNATLELCGYVQLYFRNPYDWMIGHCAKYACDGGNPVYRLRDLIDSFYLRYQA